MPSELPPAHTWRFTMAHGPAAEVTLTGGRLELAWIGPNPPPIGDMDHRRQFARLWSDRAELQVQRLMDGRFPRLDMRDLDPLRWSITLDDHSPSTWQAIRDMLDAEEGGGGLTEGP